MIPEGGRFPVPWASLPLDYIGRVSITTHALCEDTDFQAVASIGRHDRDQRGSHESASREIFYELTRNSE